MIFVENSINNYIKLDDPITVIENAYSDIPDDQICDGLVVYFSFNTKWSSFTQEFLGKGYDLKGTTWCGVCDFGNEGFHIIMMIGALRLLKEKGAKVSCFIPDYHVDMVHEDHRKMLARYDIHIGTHLDKIPKIELDIPIWFDWEKDHEGMNVSVFGYPVFASPNMLFLLSEIYAGFRPDACIDVHAYKLGVTAHLAILASHYDIPVYSINRPSYDDEGLYVNFETEPWGGAITKIGWDPFEGDDPIDIKTKRPLVFWNAPSIDGFERFKHVVMDSEEAVIVILAPTHGDNPKIIDMIKSDTRWSKYECKLHSKYDHWCEGGLFSWKA